MLTAAIDNWYAEAIISGRNNGLYCGSPTPGCDSVDHMIARHASPFWRRLARLKSVRGWLWFCATRQVDRVICTFSSRGLLVFLLLEALLGRGRRRVFFVEFLRPEPAGGKARVKEVLHILLYGWLFRHTVAGLQVMTQWEAARYAGKYGLAPERVHFVPFPMMLQPGQVPPAHTAEPPTVMASGRAACDWPTLFAASRGAPWRLLVVCARQDRPLVDRLNADGRAIVLSEIPAAEHQRLLQESAVYALALHEIGASSGQVRFARTIEAGVPVVASAVRGLEGYLDDGVTGVAVPVADAAALRAALDLLLGDEARRGALRSSAYEAMRNRTLEQFIGAIKRLSLGMVPPTGIEPVSHA
ncbi:MAG: glycosyltransferase [Burkholderiaceae bacterium]|nr:glycosyltransferase [Burkholderiaceae bacterium]